MQPQSILHVWFEGLTPKQNFVKDDALEEIIRAQFGNAMEAASKCEMLRRAPCVSGHSSQT